MTGKAMAARQAESAGNYEKLKEAILNRHNIDEETHHLLFQQYKKKEVG